MNIKAQPTSEDIAQLVDFLPLLDKTAEVYQTVKQQVSSDEPLSLVAGEPSYTPGISSFIRLASAECWYDAEYLEHMSDELKTVSGVKNASLMEICTVLTWLARGERFCEGTWGDAIQAGLVAAILLRLSELAKN